MHLLKPALAVASLPVLYTASLTLVLGGKLSQTTWDLVPSFWSAYGDTSQGQTAMFEAALLTGVLIIVFAWLFYGGPKVAKRSDARLARASELRSMGLRSRKGTILGSDSGRLVTEGGDRHKLVVAPTGSGKTFSYSVPNALHYKGSMIINDGKDRETFRATSGHRQRKLDNKIYLWDPFHPDGSPHAYNPLNKHCLRLDSKFRIYDLQRIANMYIPNPPERVAGRSMWQPEGRAIMIGLGLHMIEGAMPINFTQMYELSTSGDLQKYCLAAAKSIPGKGITKRLLQTFGTKGDREASGVRSELTSALELFMNPMISAATNHSDFSFSTFRHEASTLYINVEPHDTVMANRLLALVFQQAMDTFFMQGKHREVGTKHRVHMLIDEVSKLHHMPTLIEGLSNIADYGVTLSLIVQDIAQLQERYGHHMTKTARQNCKHTLFFAPNDFELAEQLSRQLGRITVKRRTKHKSMGMGQKGGRQYSEHEHEQAVMTPDEIMRLDPEKAILLSENNRAVVIDKIRAYNDGRFKRKMGEPARLI